ncbi:MAG TPA: hypothetical protein PLP17_08705, partial [Oligoflexia bacterium]|nr:hypothetical protein [Oligoflexia bacterium]
PLLALIVSGGHTLLVFAKEERSYEVVAKTRDDAAGEAFDKGAMLLGLPYPGGPSLSRAAIDGDFARYKLPVGVSGDPASFSFSGLKTALQRVVTQLGEKAREKEVVQDLAASYQAAIVRALTEKSVIACEAQRPRSFVLSGGVAANESLRVCLAEEMGKRGIKYCVPARRYCTDNAAMIGLLACRIIQRNPQSYRQWRSAGPQPGYLGPGVPDDIGALAKWPLGAICP